MGTATVFDLPSLRGRRGIADPALERWDTVATRVTLVRTVAAVGCGVTALLLRSVPWLGAGYAVYWLGDIADGWLARRLGQETRIGAVADIVCDRVCTVAVGAAVMCCLPWTALPVALFGAQFVLLDLPLSLGFLRWPVLSPNYFYLIDEQLFRLNWSKVAKALNTSSVILLTGLTRSASIGAVVALAWLMIKGYSLLRLRRLIHQHTSHD